MNDCKHPYNMRLLIAGAVMLLAACSPVLAQRGQLLTDDDMARLKTGETTRAEVTALLGTPTSVAVFNDNQWYYIGEDTSQTSFYAPDVLQRRVVVLNFDDKGVLQNVAQLDKNDGEKIMPADGATKVIAQEPTVLQQLIGNVGRFDSSDSKGGTAGDSGHGRGQQ